MGGWASNGGGLIAALRRRRWRRPQCLPGNPPWPALCLLHMSRYQPGQSLPPRPNPPAHLSPARSPPLQDSEVRFDGAVGHEGARWLPPPGHHHQRQ